MRCLSHTGLNDDLVECGHLAQYVFCSCFFYGLPATLDFSSLCHLLVMLTWYCRWTLECYTFLPGQPSPPLPLFQTGGPKLPFSCWPGWDQPGDWTPPLWLQALWPPQGGVKGTEVCRGGYIDQTSCQFTTRFLSQLCQSVSGEHIGLLYLHSDQRALV